MTHSFTGPQKPQNPDKPQNPNNPDRPNDPTTPNYDPWTDEIGSVDDPSSIIATIPGTIGYYPQESVIVIGLVPDETRGGELVLGPVMRADLAHAGQLGEFLDTAPVGRCVAFLGVLVTRTPLGKLATAAAHALEDLTRPCGEPLVDVLWHVSEIAQGTPYEMVFGPDPDEMDRNWPELKWSRGTVGSVVSSPAMRAWRDNGVLPALDRADTFEYFEQEPHSGVVTIGGEEVAIAELAREARLCADALRRQIDRGASTPGEFVREAMAALRNAPALPLIASDERLSLDRVFADTDDLFALVTVLSRSMLRDCVIGTAVRHSEPAATALLAVARAFDGVIRANALSLWSIVAISKGLSSWASAALATAQEDVPAHSMSAICQEILAAGQQQHLVTTILQGCELACAHIIGDAADGDGDEFNDFGRGSGDEGEDDFDDADEPDEEYGDQAASA
ncbi:DUF4192 domain-containing protein [Corynebacterium appendicis]|uniref:DUF4192 domain-containing protein n=1 Tax=Corynebacterium appendicis TaxID=163202 RepID=UPI00254CD793|nr:DUF4192 domain-containing protein [Corynebacterium appendicis]MDK8625187.1 DUF4192 domain-containing protein [Corynebacterium appendicis]